MGRAPRGVRPKSVSLRDAAVGGDNSSEKKVARLASSEPAEPPLRPHCGADTDVICPRGPVAATPSSPRRRSVGDRITLPSSALPDRGGTGHYTRRDHPKKRFRSFRWCAAPKAKGLKEIWTWNRIPLPFQRSLRDLPPLWEHP